MQASLSRRATFVLAGSALAGFAVAAAPRGALAAPMSWTVKLTGAEQVPPVDTKGSGSAALTYDPATRVVTWDITYSGLSSAVTMAHFHGPAAAGKNAGVRVWISKKGEPVSSPIKGQATLSEDDAKEFMGGDMYINVHTTDHPGGEIRGQVVPPKA